ncbi:MAG TPA: sigma-70 family RNA polymerase sigma factor [Gemmatimonadaceae bacterium]|jgi:RNA polymerase sigma-70 factor (ECF subfamily)|nr:sigma-70 family RNA polymerase sigma factor [Gemmatimonadaceae bacterium]
MDETERLFREYHAPLMRYLTRRLGDRDWADEVAQETFLRALRQPRLENERAWLFTVATNLVRDAARQESRRRRQLQLLHRDVADETADAADTAVIRAEERAAARRALEGLGERDREALLLREEGLDYGEIAAALGLAAGSVGTTLARARRRLVELVEGRPGGRAAGTGA